jgi:hypothetical protein
MAVPKGTHWGVDSFNPINHPTEGKKTLFEFVFEKTKEVPAFWGRYIGRKGPNLRQAEIDFLRRNSPGTRLLLFFNPLGLNFVEDKPRRNPLDEFLRGRDAASDARRAASALHVPAEVTIYANVEPPPHGDVSSDWIRGWWDGMGAEFGGIYGNTSAPGNVAFIGAAYGVAVKNTPGIFKPPLCAALPPRNPKSPKPADVNFGYEAGDPPGFPGAAVVWQYHVNWFPDQNNIGKFDTDLATQRGFDRMWKLSPLGAPPAPQDSNEPRLRHEYELDEKK